MEKTLDGQFRFETLEIWKEAVAVIIDIYQLTKTFPKEEIYGIISQLRRAVVSISSNIAEGSAKATKKDFKHYLDIAIGSIAECVSLLAVSRELGYCSNEQYMQIKNRLKVLIRRIYAFKNTL